MTAPVATQPAAVPAPVAPAVPQVPELKGLAKAAEEGKRLVAEHQAATAAAAAAKPDPLHPQPAPGAAAAEGAAETVVEGAEVAAAEGVDSTGEEVPAGEVPPTEAEIVVVLPARGEGEAELEIVVSDQNTADRINTLRAGAMRREEYNRRLASVERAQAEVAAFDDAISIDPIGVVMERMGGENKVHTLKALLTDPEVLAVLSQDELFAGAIQWDETALALATERVKNLRYEIRDRLSAVHSTRSARQKLAGDVLAVIERIPPAGWSEDQADQFVSDAFNDVKEYIARHGHQTFALDDLPLVLQRRLRSLGMNPLEVSQRLAAEPKDGGGGGSKVAPAAAPSPERPAAQPRQVKTAAELKAAALAREKAAAIPTGAHGAPVAGGPGLQPPPKGSGLAGAKKILDGLRGRK